MRRLTLMIMLMVSVWGVSGCSQDKKADVVVERGVDTLEVTCSDITCENCADQIKKGMAAVKGVQQTTVAIDSKKVTLVYEKGDVSEAALLKELSNVGFDGTKNK